MADVDYAALAKAAGAFKSTPPPAASSAPTVTPPPAAAGVDYAQLAKDAGATSSTAAPVADTDGAAPRPGMTFAIVNGQRVEVPEDQVDDHAGLLENTATALEKGAGVVGDVVIGAAKGAGETATHIGHAFLHAPVLGRFLGAVNEHLSGLTAEQQEAAFNEALETLKSKNWAQTIGKGAEQIGEVIVPGGAIERAGAKAVTALAPRLAPVVGETVARLAPKVVVEAASGAGMAVAQGGSPTVGALVGGAAPVVGAAVQRVAPGLRETAEKKVVEFLGPTKERFKAIAERLAPEMLKRGIRGSRQQVQEQAAAALEDAGQAIDDALFAHATQNINTAPVMAALEQAKAPFQTIRTVPLQAAVSRGVVTLDAAGKPIVNATRWPGAKIVGADVEVPIIFDRRPIEQLTKLQTIVSDLGQIVPVDKLVALRRAWDTVVAQAGGYAQRGPSAIGLPLREQTEAWAKREATGAIRKLLADQVPDLAAVNKEYAFWKNLNDVLKQTLQRTQPQGKGLIRTAAEAAGQTAGAVAGAAGGPAASLEGALFGGKLAALADKVFSSPRWKLATAQMRDRLAEAITSGNASRVGTALIRIGAVEGSKLPAAASPSQ